MTEEGVPGICLCGHGQAYHREWEHGCEACDCQTFRNSADPIDYGLRALRLAGEAEIRKAMAEREAQAQVEADYLNSLPPDRLDSKGRRVGKRAYNGRGHWRALYLVSAQWKAALLERFDLAEDATPDDVVEAAIAPYRARAEALAKFAEHGHNCGAFFAVDEPPDAACTCGLAALLAAEPVPPEPET